MFINTSCSMSGDDAKNAAEAKKARQAMMSMMGPGQADSMVRHAVQHIWMILPEEKKTLAELKAQMQRLVDRAIDNLKEDAAAFGQETPG